MPGFVSELGPTMRSKFLPFHVPSIDQSEIDEVVEVLRSGWLTTGPRVKRFEQEFAAYVGAPHAVALNSCTAALHLGLAAMDLQPGDEVLVPANTFTATAEVVTYLGGRPVIVDCRKDTFNLDERSIEERITSKTRVIVPVHIAGQPCNMHHIMEVARHHNVQVLEDAAHALPAKYDGHMVGTIGNITAFSFYATKTITTGEGGMATTSNPEYARRMGMLSLHGISHDAWKRYTAEGSWYYEVMEAGFKYNMTDVAAAMGIHQLEKANVFLDRRVKIAQQYDIAFADLPLVQTPTVQPDVQHAWHLYIILLNLEMLTLDRSQFIEMLTQHNIGTSVHFIPLHLHPFYQRTYGYKPGDFPNTEWVYERCISLPIYPGMTNEDVHDVIGAVWEVADQHRR